MNAAQRPVTFSSQPRPAQVFSQPIKQQGRPQNIRQASRRSVKRVPYAGARQAIAFESSVKLTINLLLAVVATTTIAKLVPYYQSQQSRLTTLQASVEVAEKKNNELRSQFTRNFDPTQAARIMQEQSGLSYPNQKRVIWQAPLQTGSSDTANSTPKNK